MPTTLTSATDEIPDGLLCGSQCPRIQDYGDLRIVRYEMVPLQRRVHELRHNFTAYDAMYIALAEALELPLLTCDKKFAGAPGHHADIVEYPN
jgi:predicted nucleic acid-binding protein